MKRILLSLFISIAAHAILFIIFGQMKWLSSSKTTGQPGQLTVTLSTEIQFNPYTIETTNHLDKLAESASFIAPDLPTSKLIPSDKFLMNTISAQYRNARTTDSNSDRTSDALRVSTEDLHPGNNQNQEIVGDKEIEESTRHINHTHPANWLAFVVTVSEDGRVLEYTQVSKGDANAAIYSMVTNEIKLLKIPESMHGQKILISAPPLKIETDPAITAEFL